MQSAPYCRAKASQPEICVMGIDNTLSRLTTERQGLGAAQAQAPPVNQFRVGPGGKANVAGRINPALATSRRSSKAMWMPSG